MTIRAYLQSIALTSVDPDFDALVMAAYRKVQERYDATRAPAVSARTAALASHLTRELHHRGITDPNVVHWALWAVAAGLRTVPAADIGTIPAIAARATGRLLERAAVAAGHAIVEAHTRQGTP